LTPLLSCAVRAALDFEVTAERLGRNAWVVRVNGEADLYTATELEATLEDVSGGKSARVVVDLAGGSFVDSSTLGVLLAARRRLRARGGELVLAGGRGHVLRALELTQLEDALPIEPSLPEAIDTLWKAGR
jgi:anti-sigma B factor antagonist